LPLQLESASIEIKAPITTTTQKITFTMTTRASKNGWTGQEGIAVVASSQIGGALGTEKQPILVAAREVEGKNARTKANK
jgi:hypothetical protein